MRDDEVASAGPSLDANWSGMRRGTTRLSDVHTVRGPAGDEPADTGGRAGSAELRAAWLTQRRRRYLVAAIVLLALVVRVAIVYRANRHAPNDASRLGGDEPEYDSFARNLLAGDWSDYPIRGPGYPMLLAGLRALTGGNYDLILYLQAALGALTVVPAYVLARRIGGVLAGLICAGGVALHWELASGSAFLQSEVLFTPLLLVGVLLLLRALDRPSVGRWAAAGACLGASAATRSTMLPVIVVLGLAVVLLHRPWRVGLRPAVFLVLTAAVVVVPVTVANGIKFHALVPVATSTGVVWQGSPAYYDLYRSGRTYTSIWDKELNPDVNGGHSVATADGDAYFTRRGLSSIRADPSTYVWYSAQKAAFFWLGHPSADWNDGSILDPRSLSYLPRWELGLVMLDRIVPLVALVALAILVARRRGDAEVLLVCVLLGAFTLLHAALWAEIRLSQPMVPLLAVCIGAAAVEPWHRAPRSSRRRAA